MAYEYHLKDLFRKKGLLKILNNYFNPKIKLLTESYKESKITYMLQIINLTIGCYIFFIIIPKLTINRLFLVGNIDRGGLTGTLLMILLTLILDMFSSFTRKLKDFALFIFKADLNINLIILLVFTSITASYHYLVVKFKKPTTVGIEQ